MTFAATVALVPLARRFAVRAGAVVIPRRDRFATAPVPTLGGLAIAGGLVLGLLLAPIEAPDRLALLGVVVALAALGLADDLGTVSPAFRVAVEAGAGIVFAVAVTGGLDLPIRVAAVSVAAVAFPVGVNATNLVDNADGLAGSLSLVTGATIALLATAVGIPSVADDVALLVVGACAAFLLYNLPPARLFMGDVGSLALGGMLVAVSVLLLRDAVLGTEARHVSAALIVPLAWALQLGDLVMVTITRIRRGVSPFRGGVDHTSHRLVAAGLGPRGMLALIGVAAALVSMLGVWAAAGVGDFRLVAAVVVLATLLVGAFEAFVALRLPPSTIRADHLPELAGDEATSPERSKARLGRVGPA